MPFNPSKVLRVRERASTLYSFVVFCLGFTLDVVEMTSMVYVRPCLGWYNVTFFDISATTLSFAIAMGLILQYCELYLTNRKIKKTLVILSQKNVKFYVHNHVNDKYCEYCVEICLIVCLFARKD